MRRADDVDVFMRRLSGNSRSFDLLEPVQACGFYVGLKIVDSDSRRIGRASSAVLSAVTRNDLRVNLHFTLWMCIADDSSKVKGVKAVFIRISSTVNIQSDE